MKLVQPKHTVIVAVVAARRNEINIPVVIDIDWNEGVEHAALAAGDVVTFPALRRVRRVLEPGNPPDRIRRGHFVAVFVAWPAAVASDDNVGPFVAVDIGNRNPRGMIRSDRTYMVDRPGLSGIARLCEPKYRALRFQRDGDDIQTAVGIEIEEIEVES